ncbi:MAG: Serpin (serine protease inhibitor) [Frankiales bacterium]|nr:Serpin (serine protease inhibitor) [Frankiales bacterium]
MDLSRRAFALGSLGALAACGGQSHNTRSLTRPSLLVQVRSGTARRVALGSLSASDLADAQRSSGVDLLGEVCVRGKNTTISPASAALALGLLTAGARGDTEKRLSALLHLPRWGDDVVAAYAAQHALLAGFRDQLQIANRPYTATGNGPAVQTLDDWATGFDAALTQLDISGHPQAATDRVNADVSKDTAGLIPKLLEQPLDAATSFVLVNAVHLKADWLAPFQKASTQAAPFTTESGRKVDVQMMYGGGFGTGRKADGWQSVALPYQGNHLELVVILPPPGVGCAGLTHALLTRLSRGASAGNGEVSMPKLDVSQTHDLLDVLQSLGLPVHGDYSRIGADTITGVVQKDVLRIDEKGTEAAAATAITGMATGLVVNPVSFTADRPYFLLLQDIQTETPLFLSHVVDPTA